MNNTQNGYSSQSSSAILIAIYSLERFGYYGIVAILVNYMSGTDGMDLGQAQTDANYALFSLAIMVMPFFMGLLSDLFFKRKHTILIGGLLCLIGYILLIPANEYFFSPVFSLLLLDLAY